MLPALDLAQNLDNLYSELDQQLSTEFDEPDWQSLPSEIKRVLLCSQYLQKLVQKPYCREQLVDWHRQFQSTSSKAFSNDDIRRFVANALSESGISLANFKADVPPAEPVDLTSPEAERLLDAVLRQCRQRLMLRWIYADCNRLISPEHLVQELSYFAAASLDAAIDFHHQSLAEKFGQPMGAQSGQPVYMSVLAMGKLGAYELNLSSDIDLMFCYSEAGETVGVDGKEGIDNQQFFLKLGRKIIKSIDKMTVDGFVFRVDMRLRPWGQSGALAISFDAMELYYEQHGREWERFAMIKARPIAGDIEQGELLMQQLRPFVYRKYTDFSAIQALRNMKQMINREVMRKGKENDVKLGLGGIREIEFIAQAFQIIYGGRDEHLQQRSIVKVLYHLSAVGVLPENASEALLDAYWFLRCCEHAIQALNDEQTQKLPSDALKFSRFLHYLQFEDADKFFQRLSQVRETVRFFFENVVAVAADVEAVEGLEAWRDAWLKTEEQGFRTSFSQLALKDQALEQIAAFRFDAKLDGMQEESRERLDQFMPYCLMQLQSSIQADDQALVLEAILPLLYNVLRRSSYLVLLQENPQALQHLFTIAKVSPWAMQQIVKQPVLLDELLSSEGLGRVPDKKRLKSELRQNGLRINVDDTEEQMQMLRYFKLAHHMHIVAGEATEKLPLMKVSDYLTWLAEAILDYVLDIAFAQMVEKHGYPISNGQAQTQAEFAIIAYGKLGGIELGHNSDLDLVFLYEADDLEETDGDKPLNNRTFFMRLGQKILSLLNTRTMLGQLYEVDMRLRPSGGKGLLVSSLKAFRKYQEESAWTWEHQALVRARAVSGSKEVISAFDVVRATVLQRQRDLPQLAEDVTKMRQKMADHLTPKETLAEDATLFHLKHSRGGMVDIEFMVQYGVLAHSARFPELLRYTDNIRIIETMADVGLISEDIQKQVIEAYQVLRAKGHALALKDQASMVPVDDVKAYRDLIVQAWQLLFAS